MRDDHIGENAELYALGELDELEAARVERHARTCAACSSRLGDAEATVLQLVEAGGVTTAVPEGLDRRVRFGDWIGQLRKTVPGCLVEGPANSVAINAGR